MIKPIFAQKVSTNGLVGSRLGRALAWWKRVLANEVCQLRPWEEVGTPACHLFVDAAITPPRVAAVLFLEGRVWYTDGRPSEHIMSQLADRRDKQITSLASVAARVQLGFVLA